ncbi:MAG TPA: hypothetical protein VGG97_26560 [Bryobacteraceae bacterium]
MLLSGTATTMMPIESLGKILLMLYILIHGDKNVEALLTKRH